MNDTAVLQLNQLLLKGAKPKKMRPEEKLVHRKTAKARKEMKRGISGQCKR